jgi:hypothetical protein
MMDIPKPMYGLKQLTQLDDVPHGLGGMQVNIMVDRLQCLPRNSGHDEVRTICRFYHGSSASSAAWSTLCRQPEDGLTEREAAMGCWMLTIVPDSGEI